MDKRKQAVTELIRPKKLSKEEWKKKVVNEERIRKRRDEGINSILIADVSEYLEAYKDDENIQAETKRCRDTSKAGETFKRLDKERTQRQMYNGRHDWGKDPVDDRETFKDDWWKTVALVANSNKVTKIEAKRRRKQSIKKFFYIASGRRFLDLRRVKKDEEKADASIAQAFLDKVTLEAFKDNFDKPLSENLYNFIDFATDETCWLGILVRGDVEKMVSDFKEIKRLDAGDKINKQMLLDFGDYFHKNYK